jgi:hypothetical protein
LRRTEGRARARRWLVLLLVVVMISGLTGKEEKAGIQQLGPGSAAPLPSQIDEPEPGHQEIDWFSIPMLLLLVILAAFSAYVEAFWLWR